MSQNHDKHSKLNMRTVPVIAEVFARVLQWHDSQLESVRDFPEYVAWMNDEKKKKAQYFLKLFVSVGIRHCATAEMLLVEYIVACLMKILPAACRTRVVEHGLNYYYYPWESEIVHSRSVVKPKTDIFVAAVRDFDH